MVRMCTVLSSLETSEPDDEAIHLKSVALHNLGLLLLKACVVTGPAQGLRMRQDIIGGLRARDGL